MIQKLTLLTFTALLVAFMFSACSDVTSPNENIGSEISSAETELQDIRRRMAAAAETTPTIPTSCSLQGQIISYGGANESIQERIANGKNVGSISLTIDDGKIIITAKVDDPTIWLIDKTDLDIAKNPNGNFPGSPGNFEVSNSHNPHVPEFSYTVTLSDYNINPGDEFYVAMHVNVNGQQAVDGSGKESSWGGKEEGPGNRRYFKVTNTCPATGTYTSAG